MSLLKKAVFHTSAARLAALPKDSVLEVAFAGRSNAGKSSAINALVGKTGLAHVSKTPGRTQHINYFSLASGKYLVDLPGYGFAKVPEAVKRQWEGLLAPYLGQREPLTGLILIMDCRRPLTELDWRMLDWFAPTGRSIHILLTKADKLSRQAQMEALKKTRDALNILGEQCSIQLFSSLKKTGLEECGAVLARWLDFP